MTRSAHTRCRSLGNGYASQCCDAEDPNSFASWLTSRPKELASTLEDMIVGGLRAVGDVDVPSCAATGKEPTKSNNCLAQCFHVSPDVFYAHLHTTVSVAAIREAPVDSGLGPAYNASESDRRDKGYYNVCACEPKEWPGRRGNCPAVAPADRSVPAPRGDGALPEPRRGGGRRRECLRVGPGDRHRAFHVPRRRPAAPRVAPRAALPCPALALGTGEGVLDGSGVGVTGVAWVDVLYVFFILGICGLIYTTTIDDFGSNVDRTSVRLNDEWAKALDDDDDDEGEDRASSRRMR